MFQDHDDIYDYFTYPNRFTTENDNSPVTSPRNGNNMMLIKSSGFSYMNKMQSIPNNYVFNPIQTMSRNDSFIQPLPINKAEKTVQPKAGMVNAST